MLKVVVSLWGRECPHARWAGECLAWYGHSASGARRWRCSPVASLAGELSARSAALVPRRSSVVCSWLVRCRRRALWAVVSVGRLLVCLTIDAAACRVRPRADRATRQVTGSTKITPKGARGTDSTILLVVDRMESSRSGGTLPMGWLSSSARARQRHDGRPKRTPQPAPVGGARAPASPTPPSTMPETNPRPTRIIQQPLRGTAGQDASTRKRAAVGT